MGSPAARVSTGALAGTSTDALTARLGDASSVGRSERSRSAWRWASAMRSGVIQVLSLYMSWGLSCVSGAMVVVQMFDG
jgi:hypothetical protein